MARYETRPLKRHRASESFAMLEGGTSALEKIVAAEESTSRIILESARQKLQDALGPSIEIKAISTHGHILDKIIKIADDQNVDQIIMGAQEQSGLKRLVIGSLARSVIAGAHCDVKVIRNCPELSGEHSQSTHSQTGRAASAG